MSSVTVVSVFGNLLERQDNLAVKLVPELMKRFKKIDFRIEDPTESLEPASDPWVILDVAEGIDEVTVIEDLDSLERVRGSSAHDYDVYLELRLRKKLGQLPKIKLILIPYGWDKKQAMLGVSRAISA